MCIQYASTNNPTIQQVWADKTRLVELVRVLDSASAAVFRRLLGYQASTVLKDVGWTHTTEAGNLPHVMLIRRRTVVVCLKPQRG